MNYPIWGVPFLGGGMLIGMIAILHVFISHFAVGGGLFLVLAERKAYRENDTRLLSYIRGHSLFFVLLTLVLGAVTGAGIWWTIALVHPPATSALIHIFVWGWAIEWTFFTVEIAAALFYYYGWDRMDRRTHMTIGAIYFGAAWMSLFVINGILTFMLTPGQWLEERTFASAFFNPTMLPSLFIRTGVSIALAGLYGLLTASFLRDQEHRQNVIRYAAKWVLAGTAIFPFAGPWFIAKLPPLARDISMGGAPAITIFASFTVVFSTIIVLFTLLGPYWQPRHFGFPFAALLLVMGMLVTGVTEMVREAVRKPYIIYGYMYSNAVRPEDVPRIQSDGVLRHAKWVRERDAVGGDRDLAGAEVFRVQCQSCHTVDGFNGVRLLTKGWSMDYTGYQMDRLHQLKPYMPPFMGTPEEREALAEWLVRLNHPEARAEAPAPGATASLTEVSR